VEGGTRSKRAVDIVSVYERKVAITGMRWMNRVLNYPFIPPVWALSINRRELTWVCFHAQGSGTDDAPRIIEADWMIDDEDAAVDCGLAA
jgi:hypothetical protein